MPPTSLPRLLQAAFDNDIQTVKELVASGEDPNQTAKYQPEHLGYVIADLTPLMVAAGSPSSSPEMVTVLLELGADVNLAGEYETTPIYYASSGNLCSSKDEIEKSDESRAKRITVLANAGANPHAWANGPVLVESAAGSGSLQCLKALLNAGAPRGGPCPRRDCNISILHYAARSGSTLTLDFALSLDFDPTLTYFEGDTALFWANTSKACELLVNAGLDVRAKDEEGRNALEHALLQSWIESASWLHGQGLSISDETMSSLLEPFYMKGAALKFALDAGYKVPTDYDLNGTFNHAVWSGESHEDSKLFVETLITLGVDTTQIDQYGQSLLHEAVHGDWGSPTTTEVLLKHGLDPNLRDNRGITPLMLAAEWGEVECAKILLANGADPHIKDKKRKNAMFYAAENLKTWIQISKNPTDFSSCPMEPSDDPFLQEIQAVLDQLPPIKTDPEEETRKTTEHHKSVVNDCRTMIELLKKAMEKKN